ncbi:MAG: hypothetical protein IPQ18_04105 [Saprospiraceae bacterium]|nr:hypothetical protein [Saprospiraceae bacterium]
MLQNQTIKAKYFIFHEVTTNISRLNVLYVYSLDLRMTEVDMAQNEGLGKINIKEKKIIEDTLQ